MKTNLLFPVFLFVGLIIRGRISQYGKYIPAILLLLVLTAVNVTLSIDPVRSAWVSIDSILAPILFYLILMTFPRRVFLNQQSLTNIFMLTAAVFFFIGFSIYVGVGIASSDSLYERSGGGIFLSNVGTQIAAFFFPLLLFGDISIKYSRSIRAFFLICFIALLFIALSRTGFAVYAAVAFVCLYRGTTGNKIMKFLSIAMTMLLFVYLAQRWLDIDLVEMFVARLQGDNESVINTIGNDGRFDLYRISLDSFYSNSLTGIGISNFVQINDRHFTNAHNIILNILVERGVLIFLMLSTVFYKMLKGLNRCIDLNQDSSFYLLLKYGVIGYFAIGLTGNDLFLSSGFVNAWPMYFLALIYSIQEKGRGQRLTDTSDKARS